MSPYCSKKASPNDESLLIDVVNKVYSQQALQGADRAYTERVANAFGYTVDELQSIPDEAHMGLSCGNPVATAFIKTGETVVDLGSGGGIDVFLAAAKVGPTGQVIGLDNSEEMIALARRNAAVKGLRPPHVAFVKASLVEDLPIESNSVDCILSNCVINLLPPSGKIKVVQEVYRILKPGGRVSLGDIMARKPYPESLRTNVAAYVSCMSGAILLEEYRALLHETGFKDALFTETQSDLNIYLHEGSTGCCETMDSATCVSTDIGDLNEWAKSYQIYATKSSDATTTGIEPESVPGPRSALKNWWDAYPSPSSTTSPESLECLEVAGLIRNLQVGKNDFVVVDVRRDDHAGGHFRGSVQQPAQTFYDDLAKFYEDHKQTKRVIFYCDNSNGRGLRCAKWYQDYLDQQGNINSKAFVMSGGVKEWISMYKEQEDLVEFD